MTTQAASAPPVSAAQPSIATVIFASVIGTTIEWYDFLIYGTAAALVFNKLFFPNISPLAGTLAAFSTYAVGFVARPVGGAIFGHFGDRIGRKSILMLTMLIMGLGTFFVGLLPTYHSIGIWAAVLLVILRFAQGLGIGGEWGGAVLMAVECSNPRRRGLCGALVQAGFPVGLVLSTGIFAWLSKMPEASFLSWGWRVPFLLSAILVIIGLFIRFRLAETPVFAAVKATQTTVRMPLAEVFRKYPKNFLISLAVRISEVSWVYILTVFVIVYVTKTLGMSKSVALNGILVGACLELITVPLFGALSDIWGRRPMYVIGGILSALFAFPLFWMLDTRDPAIVTLAIALGLAIGHGMVYGPQASFLSELFGTRVRYSGASFGYQLSAAIGGGFSPLIATGLLAWAGGPWGISVYMATLALTSVIFILMARETARDSLTEEVQGKCVPIAE